MKKLITAIALSTSVLAAPAALAQTADGVGTFTMAAPVATYCVFGTTGNSASTSNATATNDSGEGIAGADVRATFDLQTATDTGRAASVTLNIPTVVCNTPFTVTGVSVNGGLKNPAITTDTDFTNLLGYTATVNIDTVGGSSRALSVAQGSNRLMTSTEARAGAGVISVNVAATPKLLLQGSYTDTFTVTMAPSVGG